MMTTRLHGIPANAPVMVDSGEPHATTWGEFCRDNADADPSDVELAEISSVLRRRPGCTYHGGGGASLGGAGSGTFRAR